MLLDTPPPAHEPCRTGCDLCALLIRTAILRAERELLQLTPKPREATGWKCPNCGRCYAPHCLICQYCGQDDSGA